MIKVAVAFTKSTLRRTAKLALCRFSNFCFVFFLFVFLMNSLKALSSAPPSGEGSLKLNDNFSLREALFECVDINFVYTRTHKHARTSAKLCDCYEVQWSKEALFCPEVRFL